MWLVRKFSIQVSVLCPLLSMPSFHFFNKLQYNTMYDWQKSLWLVIHAPMQVLLYFSPFLPIFSPSHSTSGHWWRWCPLQSGLLAVPPSSHPQPLWKEKLSHHSCTIHTIREPGGTAQLNCAVPPASRGTGDNETSNLEDWWRIGIILWQDILP